MIVFTPFGNFSHHQRRYGKVNISQSTYEKIRSQLEFQFESRGKVDVKGKGEVEMYFVSKVK